MIEVFKEDRDKIEHIFDNMHDSVILTCLQGHMGRAWTDDFNHPKIALIQVGDFCFLAGQGDTEERSQMVKYILALAEINFAIVIPENKMLGDLIEMHYCDECKKIQRFAIKRKNDEFDLEKLQRIINDLPKQYTLSPIDETWYEVALKEDWSRDLVSNFISKDEYIKNGIGRVIIHDGKIVSGASSYTYYNEGIEIEIDTRKDYRRKGLAQVAGAALILACRERGLYPSWDAANMMSVHLAEKLGYEFDQPYDCYMIWKRE